MAKIGGRDPGEVTCRWARELMRRDGARDIEIRVFGRRVELVGERNHSERVLAASPAWGGHPPGKLKTTAMSFLAPSALTIADGDAWARLRPFNEQVLATGGPHPFAQAFLDSVREAFARPLADRDDVEAAMGRAMVGIVLGRADPGDDVAGDVTRLMAVVQSPLRRKLLGFWYARLREKLYASLERHWEASGDRDLTLLGLARRAAPESSRRELLEQVPHWMFTFTGSGTDLLTRTLAVIVSRSEVRRRVVDEIKAAGPLDRADSIERLDYLKACLLETGRLFQPVTRTFHRSQTTGSAGGEGFDVIHWFPLLQRDDELGATVHDFRPDRWLGDALDPAAAASNLFLRGPRACPGKDLILFVCKAAIARQVGELGLGGPLNGGSRASRLAHDPLPVSFPEGEAQFTASEASR
jgi:cytochrome P450